MDQFQGERDPLCVHGNCMANSLLLCCQKATGDRTRDALRGFTAISSRYPTTAAEWQLNCREAELREAKAGMNVSFSSQKVSECGYKRTRGCLTSQGRGRNVLSASAAH